MAAYNADKQCRQEPTSQEVGSTLFVLLHSQSNQAAVILALLTASLLEGVEVVRHSKPQHTALILAIVFEVEEVVMRPHLPLDSVEDIGQEYRYGHSTLQEALLYAYIHLVRERGCQLRIVLWCCHKVLHLNISTLPKCKVEQEVAIVCPASIVDMSTLEHTLGSYIVGIRTHREVKLLRWFYFQR